MLDFPTEFMYMERTPSQTGWSVVCYLTNENEKPLEQSHTHLSNNAEKLKKKPSTAMRCNLHSAAT